MYLVWQNDNTVLGIASTEEKAQQMCTQYCDSYMFIQEDTAQRQSEEVTEDCIYKTPHGFLSFKECKELGYEFTKLNTKFKNKKNGKIYTVIDNVINCTNAQDGQEMFLYTLPNCDMKFVRSKQEFLEKFELVK